MCTFYLLTSMYWSLLMSNSFSGYFMHVRAVENIAFRNECYETVQSFSTPARSKQEKHELCKIETFCKLEKAL